MVAVLYIMGVSSIREFAAPLMVGIICGAYSSVCITGALWLVMKKKICSEQAQPAIAAAAFHIRRSNLSSKPKKAPSDVSQKDPTAAEEEKQKESS